MFLDEILRRKIKSLERDRERETIDNLLKRIEIVDGPEDFRKAIYESKAEIKIIAEIKRASPSRGIIRQDFYPEEIARIYQKAGACAISVLTEEEFFLGNLELLSMIAGVVTIPILRKDFIIDKYQIYQSRAYGADTILLMSNILDEKKLKEFIEIARKIGMEPLVEVHTEEDLKKGLDCGAEIIGINNRDLNTFKVDISVTEKLIRYIPDDKIVISESGINSREDLIRLKSLGVDGFLIGEAFMRENNIEKKVSEFISGGFS